MVAATDNHHLAATISWRDETARETRKMMGRTMIVSHKIQRRLSLLSMTTLMPWGCPACVTIQRSPSSVSPSTEHAVPASQAEPASEGGSLTICSFNVQFLGNSPVRDDAALASILSDYDIVVVQELVSPPYDGAFPGGDPFRPDPQSAEFFDEMELLGFDFVLSEEDTGTGENIHRNGSVTEWWVAFFKPAAVNVAADLPSGFLAADRSNNDDYERVPYAFAFRSADESSDFVLISVHLKPGASEQDRRRHELATIASWIDTHDQTEKDFIILGDMNIKNADELEVATPDGYLSLNDECRPTNTNVNGPKPYDHIMFNTTHTGEIDQAFDFQVVDLIEAMRGWWDASTGAYPGDPYDHNRFRRYYSDHHPIVFRMTSTMDDD